MITFLCSFKDYVDPSNHFKDQTIFQRFQRNIFALDLFASAIVLHLYIDLEAQKDTAKLDWIPAS